jgi:hypothetical protein
VIPLAAVNQLAAVYRGRGRDEAYLDFAQEHFLDWLRLEVARRSASTRSWSSRSLHCSPG